ncbi:transposase domain-containing protein [Gigaspora margarita]|uniref:Transposase domain-containing protein n=1 Tax=Gigaspora margarita TaxID=4874 RepID=A0A8H4A3U7_GIGMA|nr:transposase domain-containing protein [Gigaspora margarita]
MELEVLENFNRQIYIQQIKTKAYHYLPQNFLSSLNLITQANIEKTGTLGHYNFTVQEALDFCAMSGGLINHIYYSEIYSNYNFYDKNQLPKSENSILVSSTARRATDLKLGDEKYGSFFSCSDLNSHVLACWQLENERVNWPGIIKFFIEHRVSLPNSKAPTSHYLAIVDWYRRDSQKQSYFHVKSRDKIFKNILSTNADRTYHAELWEDRFVERGIATILPIQRIICRFVKSNGIKLPGRKKNIVIMPLNRKFSSYQKISFMAKATLNTLSTNITSLTQSINEMKTILNSSDIKSQLEITKNSIDSLKRRFDIYEQNHNEFATTIQRVNNEHGIKIQRIEDTLMTATTTLENLSTSTSALQDTTNNILLHIQSHGNNISSITNATINSPHTITVANPVLTAKVHDKMRYFNGFDDLESQSQDHSYIYDFEHGPKNRKNKKITRNYVDLFIKEFDVQFENTQTNEKWNETTITEICEAYFKTLKKERNTTPAAKMLNDQRSRRRKRRDAKSLNRLAALNKIPENNLNYPKIEVERLFSFEATSPEVSDAEETPISGSDNLDISQSSRKKILVPVLPWISDEAIRIRGLLEDFIKQNQMEKLNSGGRHSYTIPLPREVIKMDNPRWITMRSMIPPKPKDLPNWAWNQINPSEYFENSDDNYDDIYDE